MKNSNIVIFSLYNPLLNNIASQRIEGFRNFLVKDGFNVQVISRYYSKELRNGAIANVTCIPNSEFSNTHEFLSLNYHLLDFDQSDTLERRIKKLPFPLGGIYAYYKIDPYHSTWADNALEKFSSIYSKTKIDHIILSYGPPIVLKLARMIHKQFPEVKILVDFRDLYINESDGVFHLLMKKIVIHQISKSVDAWLFISVGMKGYFELKTGVIKEKSVIVHNGISEGFFKAVTPDTCDDSVVIQFNKIKNRYKFVFLHSGSIYSGQDIGYFLQGFKECNSKNNNYVALVFLGLADHDSSFLKQSYVFTLGRVSHKTSAYLMKKADGLILPIWNGRYTGWSGKTYEYLASGSRVLVGPDPQSELLEYFNRNKNLLIFNKAISFKEQFELFISRPLNLSKIDEGLFRSYWVQKLSDFIRNKL